MPRDGVATLPVELTPVGELLLGHADEILGRLRLAEDDVYLREISKKWQLGIVKLVNEMPAPDFTDGGLTVRA